ncbi:polysaccharide deacetylase family protein [Dermacoccus abyssi]|uniref:polysaccharide deacetylase n=1 Tax=Dermacoccus abyssi TaxID=322596 RepID=UPI002AD2AA19|nr:polysaccharide deacetylase [Dermacoccus abyssi]
MFTSAARTAVAALVIVTASGGCSSGGGDGGASRSSRPVSPGASSSASTKTSSPRADDPVARARELRHMYDYAAATAALKGQTSTEADAERRAINDAKAKAKPFADTTQISHVFYHSLVVDPALAFHAGQGKAQGYKDYMVTKREFVAQLNSMYAKGYVLVHPQRVAKRGADGQMHPVPIVLPAGKKPLVLSVDDVSYYEYMAGDGFATSLVVDGSKGVRTTYPEKGGKVRKGADDVVPIVDDFVREHPDFSYRGDKGTIALTGYNGVLGYRSSYAAYGHSAKTDAERAKARTVANAMKASGWNFASHSYGHINITKASLATIKADAARWDADVKPIVGPTKEIIFAFGADISDTTPYSMRNPKYAFLHNVEGFDYFANVDGSRSSWIQFSQGSMRQGRINIDGIALDAARDGESSVLSNFFDPVATRDPARP